MDATLRAEIEQTGIKSYLGMTDHRTLKVVCTSCGKTLRYEFKVLLNDGGTISLGRECVRHLRFPDDAALSVAIDTSQQATTKSEGLQLLLAEESVRNVLRLMGHPKEQGLTYFDYCQDVAANASARTSSQVLRRVISVLRKHLKSRTQ